MDKVMKFLSSPLSRRKNITNNPALANHGSTSSTQHSVSSNGVNSTAANQNVVAAPPAYFGTHLEDLLNKEGGTIPKLVTDVCNYVLHHGTTTEGVFRVNGNQRCVERMRTSYEQTGSADLDAVGDVMAVAGLLKLFLRELPGGLISQPLSSAFVKKQQELAGNNALCLAEFRGLIGQLGPAQRELLKYLCNFLHVFSQHQGTNKMSPTALGIVFGPNIFRCSDGLEGLKVQGVTNHVTATFIQEYDTLFPREQAKNGTKRAAPAPPRQLGTTQTHPVPPPRKQGRELGQAGGDDESGSARSSDATSARAQQVFSDEETLDTGRYSPFVLDTDRSEYSLNTTSQSQNTEAVDRVIRNVISEHLFIGITSVQEKPVAPPRRRRAGDKSTDKSLGDEDYPSSNDSDNELKLTVKQRIQQLEQDKVTPGNTLTHGKPQKQRPKNDAFETFEKKGLVIGPAPERLLKTLALGGDGAHVPVESDEEDDSTARDTHAPEMTSPVPAPRRHLPGGDRGGGGEEAEESFSSFQASHRTLSNFKKPTGPKNRRTPTRKPMKGAEGSPVDSSESNAYSINTQDGDEEKENPVSTTQSSLSSASNNSHPVTKPLHLHIPETQHHPEPASHRQGAGDMPGEQLSPNMKFLEVPFRSNAHNGGGGGGSGINGSQGGRQAGSSGTGNGSPDKSPVGERKPYVPPLDLSILHEHGDGSDPIPVQHGQSASLHKAQLVPDSSHAMVSPRSNKHYGQKSGGSDLSMPPSPPMDHAGSCHQRIEEDLTREIKQHTKKIQSCKRRIKQFEDAFEAQHGYRPSQTDKASKADVKRCMQELAMSRKELRRLKEEQPRVALNRSGGDSSPGADTGGGGGGKTSAGTPSMRDSLHALLKRLCEKRKEGKRPDDLTMMSMEQVQDEKLAIQKTLLHFESIHGRPSTKSEKELMRPLYDRYRNVKRLLAKGNTADGQQADLLQTVPEDRAIEFEPESAKTTFSNREPIRVPTAEPEDEEQNAFLVTRDTGLLGDTVAPNNSRTGKAGLHTSAATMPKPTGGGWFESTQDKQEEGGRDGLVNVSPEKNTRSKNLHEMTVPQLFEEQRRGREEKKLLRVVLREFEDEFQAMHGRKVQKEDRSPMATEYQEYKQTKARLKLLDALLSKHDASPDLF